MRSPYTFLERTPPVDGPPPVHTLPVGVPIRPGAKALCGERVLGIKPQPRAPLCTMCESMRKDGGQL